MILTDGATRRFLFLQGPHGPFFAKLARRLRVSGATCHRVGFSFGDRAFWTDGASYTAFRGPLADWPETCAALLDTHEITDLVLYGDTRPVHAEAIKLAKARGLRVHVFEEGYLRPWWVTYERGGSNGHSPLMDLSMDDIRAALTQQRSPPIEAPAHWGEMRHHVFYGALYHALVLAGQRGYRQMAPHRGVTVGQEFVLHFKRLVFMPLHWAQRAIATARIKRGGYPYHLVLLQLDHDASLRHHGAFPTTRAFFEHVIEGFATGAPPHHHLVLKAHPLEDGRVPQRRLIGEIAGRFGVADRVHYLRGGKLAHLLDNARSALTVNSTAAQQALWRGLPVRAFGASVYARPELTSDQPVAAFFADPQPPDRAAYTAFRQYLLQSSQLPGGYYSTRGRRQLYRQIVDRMLAEPTPKTAAASAQHLRVVSGTG
ncbi:MAG: capsule biosynthesis protein CapA [Rhodobacteraceae bacterium]|nr:capsule biosynthesis protein CapA [Alphaproteobacteria bacterium]MBT8475279.1 capsule biosynthesis protein CapA [Alphaproteobacteria bacterium]NNK66535.1 capsule biosynthesis protein CapA [Paracoccaceae bacterium]